MAEELTVQDLRVIRRALNEYTREPREVLETRTRVVAQLEEKLATRHMVETGHYPTWYKDGAH